MTFFSKAEPKLSAALPGYYLGDNPFPELDLKKEQAQPLEILRQALYRRETRRLWRVLMAKAGETQDLNLWIIKDDSGGTEHNIAVIAETFRHLVESDEPRMFPVYAALPLIYQNPLAGILRMSLDRLTDESFRRCVAGFVFQELTNLPDYESEPPFERGDFLKRMEESEGQLLDEILGLKEEVKGQSEVKSQESEEVQEGQPEVRSQESEGEDLETRKQREWLLSFVDRRAEEAKLGDEVRKALKVALTKGWRKGREGLAAANAQKEVLMGAYKLISRYYKRVIVFMDQLEGWPVLDEGEQAAFFGAVAELNWFASPGAIVVFASYPHALEAMGERIAKQFQFTNLNLRQAYLNLASVDKEEVQRTIIEFLRSDPYREERQNEVVQKHGSELWPFTEKALNKLCTETNCNLVDILFIARNLLEAGKAQGYVEIDDKFVKKNLAGVSR